jgi:hypothetical protein
MTENERVNRQTRVLAMHDFFLENLLNPAHECRAGMMWQCFFIQLDST